MATGIKRVIFYHFCLSGAQFKNVDTVNVLADSELMTTKEHEIN